jgi:hypothetical protein
MSTDLENITAFFGLVRREFRDVRAWEIREHIGPRDWRRIGQNE